MLLGEFGQHAHGLRALTGKDESEFVAAVCHRKPSTEKQPIILTEVGGESSVPTRMAGLTGIQRILISSGSAPNPR